MLILLANAQILMCNNLNTFSMAHNFQLHIAGHLSGGAWAVHLSYHCLLLLFLLLLLKGNFQEEFKRYSTKQEEFNRQISVIVSCYCCCYYSRAPFRKSLGSTYLLLLFVIVIVTVQGHLSGSAGAVHLNYCYLLLLFCQGHLQGEV